MSFGFRVIKKAVIEEAIQLNFDLAFNLIAQAYLMYKKGAAVNPPSYFLKFPNKPNARIIALPCYLDGDFDVAGIKWISSFPDNVQDGFQRASAIFILNDGKTGYPLACMESSYISAIRTSLSAVLVGELLHNKQITTRTLTLIGAGFIAKNILETFYKRGWKFDAIHLFDKNKADAEKFANAMNDLYGNIIVEDDVNFSIQNSDTVVFATTALQPYLADPEVFKHSPVILHISLRDLAADVILSSNNYVDDAQHILAAGTSPHLAFEKSGHHQFINGTVADLLDGSISINRNKPAIFSPMGMGILDLVLAQFIYNYANETGKSIEIEDFFGDISR